MTTFLKSETAAAAVEYCIIAAVMGLALFNIMPALTSALSAQFSNLASHIAAGK